METCLSWFTYIIQNQKGSLYTGITNDPLKRLKDHNTSNRGAKATRIGRPWCFVFIELQMTKSSALKREYAIKKLSRAQKLLLIEAHNFVEQAALCRNDRELRYLIHDVSKPHQVSYYSLAYET